ncbi:hypothetical protein FRB95_014427 [Tulasnella sp. JGI-2019a]|nr:hypothetical protein FRB95_014427 [Tulasnella sp. JGI-2019a]
MPATAPFAKLHDYCRREKIELNCVETADQTDPTNPIWTATITVQPADANAYEITGPKALQRKLARNLAAEIAINDLGLSDVIVLNTGLPDVIVPDTGVPDELVPDTSN